MVYSATSSSPSRPAGHLLNQLLRVVFGVAAFAWAYKIDYHRWGRRAPTLFLGGLVMLALVWVPGLGHSAGGARRWITIAGVTLQPSEFARLGLIVYLAYLLSKPKARLERFTTGIAPCLVAVGLVASLVLMQRHLSMTLALGAIATLMLAAGRIPRRHLAVLGASILVLPFTLH
jgi:cell division protein FtsW